jgi:hypothetical protein
MPPCRPHRGLVALAVLVAALAAVLAACGSGTPPSEPSSSAHAVVRGLVKPAQTGFQGTRSKLKVVPDDGVPAGCVWDPVLRYLECKGDAVIKDLYVKGGVDAYADLTITDSVIAANPTNWVLVNERSSGGHCSITHSTLTFANDGRPPANSGSWGVAGVNDMNGCRGDYEFNDISGTPDGIDTGADHTVIAHNYIHDLAIVGTPPNETHNDGIQLFGCSGCSIVGNYVDIGWDGVHQNSCFFESDGTPGRGIVFTDNYLSGGGYPFRNMIGTDMTVARNRFHLLPRQFGPTLIGPSATFAQWYGNRLTTGAIVARPAV